MADKKISELTDLAATPAVGDQFPLVDISTGETKRVNFDQLNVALKNIVEDLSPELGAELDAGAFKIVDLGAPAAATDAARKGEVDAKMSNLSEDATPQLGGDLDVNDKNIELMNEPSDDDTASGLIVTATVDTNAQGIGAPLYMAADGHLDTADADSSATAPCIALAVEAGTGSKKILLHGVLRNDGWNWTTGPGKLGLIYLSTSVGTLTQTKPSGTDDVIQPVGWALSDDCIYFCPSMMYFTHT